MRIALHVTSMDEPLLGTHVAPRKPTAWRVSTMNLWLWLPGTFLMGLGGLALCYVFLTGCEKI